MMQQTLEPLTPSGLGVCQKFAINIKLGIGIPLAPHVDSEFVINLVNRLIEMDKKPYGIEIIFDPTYPLDMARNKIVKKALDKECDYLYFWDADNYIEADFIDKLLAHNKDVIAGIYSFKNLPFAPILKRRVSDTLYLTMYDYKENELIEVDGMGLGCCLIKMDVFKNVPYPWFKNEFVEEEGEWHVHGEDLYFFKMLKEHGYKIYADTRLKVKHDKIHPDMYKPFRDSTIKLHKEQERTFEELVEFTGISESVLWKKVNAGVKLVRDEFIKAKAESKESTFYADSKCYVYDLIYWHLSERRAFDLELIESAKNAKPKKILDFGSGIGQNAIMLAEAGFNVSMMDIVGYTSDFARFRAKKRNLNIPFYSVTEPCKEKFDLILCFDVLEHIPDDMFADTIALLQSLKADGGKVAITASFGYQKAHPMHFLLTEEKKKLIEDLLK